MNIRQTTPRIIAGSSGDAVVDGAETLGHEVGTFRVDFTVVLTVVGAVVGTAVGAVVRATRSASTVVVSPSVTFTIFPQSL